MIKNRTHLFLGALAGALVCAQTAQADPTVQEVRAVLHRDFHPKGQAKMDRVDQDAVQRLCTLTHDRPPSALTHELEADQLKTVRYPSGSLMGDWKKGEKIAKSGHGMTWKDKPGKPNGGSCFNCHQLDPREPSYGTIGPSLKGIGKTRSHPNMRRYIYAKIYNAKAYNLCSQMPRLGYSGTLTEGQIKDLVAYLLSPDSPVNK